MKFIINIIKKNENSEFWNTAKVWLSFLMKGVVIFQ